LIGVGAVGQAAVPSLIDAGSVVGALAPSALLGIGLLWSIRRGDSLVKEIHDLRDKHEAELKSERAEFKSILEKTTETLTSVNITLKSCEERSKKK
jgi:hypothetical protein